MMNKIENKSNVTAIHKKFPYPVHSFECVSMYLSAEIPGTNPATVENGTKLSSSIGIPIVSSLSGLTFTFINVAGIISNNNSRFKKIING
jgi:hypothetical protein